MRRGPRRGTVVSFEDERGVGTVEEEDGATFFFHCTALTDGSRQVEVGQPILFVVRPGHGGRLEARELDKC